METIAFWAALVGVLLLGALGAVVVYKIARSDLSGLISEQGEGNTQGTASMSRFQLLIFTFVIALGLLVITLKCGKFPMLSAEVLGLLGISVGSYIGSKITQKAAETKQATLPKEPPPKPTNRGDN